MPELKKHDYTAVVIGTGFGATMTAIPLAQAFTNRNSGKPPEAIETVLMLERGTWWTTPISTVQDKEIKTAGFLIEQNQPVQYWSAPNNFRGFLDIFSRCYRRTKDENVFTKIFKSLRNEDGLYDLMRLGTRGFLGLFGRKSDGISVIRATGVGGGSLVYPNITIQPPDFVLTDPRWPTTWDKQERERYYDLARHAISFGVISALKAKKIPFTDAQMPPDAINAGLSNIVARTARLKLHWDVAVDPNNRTNVRGIKRYHQNPPPATPPDPNAPPVPDRSNALWLDRARVFQTAVKDLTSDYGAVDLAINDVTPEDSMLGIDPNGLPSGNFPHDYPLEKSVNYCERQGRCNVGCLPGARHTLNKQLMAAALGKFDRTPPTLPNLTIQALSEVDVVRALPEGGYEIQYLRRHQDDPSKTDRASVTADIVIVSAGCLGSKRDYVAV